MKYFSKQISRQINFKPLMIPLIQTQKNVKIIKRSVFSCSEKEKSPRTEVINGNKSLDKSTE